MNFDPSQQAAIAAAAAGQDCIITGGAGTGKTTVIKAIADALRGHIEQIYRERALGGLGLAAGAGDVNSSVDDSAVTGSGEAYRQSGGGGCTDREVGVAVGLIGQGAKGYGLICLGDGDGDVTAGAVVISVTRE